MKVLYLHALHQFICTHIFYTTICNFQRILTIMKDLFFNGGFHFHRSVLENLKPSAKAGERQPYHTLLFTYLTNVNYFPQIVDPLLC